MAYIETSIQVSIAVFIAATIVIGIAGTLLTRVSDRLADATKIGEAVFGAVLLGGMTSLSGIIASVTAAYEGQAEMAISNAIGGIAAQTTFLAVADIFYRKANLEHASASLQNILLGVLLFGQLALVLLVMSAPDYIQWGVHPASFLGIGMYIAGVYFASKVKDSPMWYPKSTQETVEDVPHYAHISKREEFILWGKFFVLALIVGTAGYVVARAGIGISAQTNLSGSFVGAMFIAVATSLPELVVVVAAVRQESLNMAVGNIIGGNTFDVLFVAFADMAFMGGSIYHALSHRQTFIISLTLLMVAILLFGMLFREKHGPGQIGWESLFILLLFVGGYSVMYFM